MSVEFSDRELELMRHAVDFFLRQMPRDQADLKGQLRTILEKLERQRLMEEARTA